MKHMIDVPRAVQNVPMESTRGDDAEQADF